MVRSKTLNVLSGRKQRIEGIVKNLSAKVKTKGLTSATNGSGKSDPLAALFQPRTESQYTATTTRNDSADSAYHLPAGLEFSGIISSQLLLKGRQFGPFVGKITPETEQPCFNHSFVCQIPDFDGNNYGLHLLTSELDSCKWLKCLKRFTPESVCNVVAYNTPMGVVLETVAEIGEGVELCFVYDQSYDSAELSVTGNQAAHVPGKDPTGEKSIEEFLSMRPTSETDVLATFDEEHAPLYSSHVVSADTDGYSRNETDSEESQHINAPYRVMMVDLSGNPSSANEETSQTVVGEEKKGSKLTQSDFRQKNPKASGKGKKHPFFKAYRCHSCKSQFETSEEKQQHLATCHSRECPMCKKTYSRAYLKEHIMFHQESSRLTCTICVKVFSSISNLRKHQKKHDRHKIPTTRATAVRDQVQIYQCSECPKTFKSEKQMEIHRKKHVRLVPISCGDCDEIFTHKSLLRRHQAIVHQGKKPYSCKHCDKTFTQSGNLARHCRQVHSDNKDVRGRGTKEKYLCRRRGCDQESFTSRELFIKHLEKHAGSGGIFPCGDCNGVFSSLSNLNKHKKTQHKGDVVPAADQAKFSCDLCKADFQNEYLYQKHLRNHQISKQENKCEQCGKLFANRSGLFKHVRLLRCSAVKEKKPSKPERIHKCSACGKTFPCASDLKTHRRSHSLVRQFVCELCGKSFNQPGNLGKHIRHVHQRIPRPKDKPRTKKLICDVCHKAFASSSALEKHSRTHAALKPLKCEHCQRRFTQMGGLKKHMSRCNKIVNFSASDSAGDGPVVTPLNTGDTDHSPRPSVPAGVERTSVGYSGGGLTKSDGEEEECLKEPASPVF